ncbi:unnamed protein product [Jaminaea pallidilutea]
MPVGTSKPPSPLSAFAPTSNHDASGSSLSSLGTNSIGGHPHFTLSYASNVPAASPRGPHAALAPKSGPTAPSLGSAGAKPNVGPAVQTSNGNIGLEEVRQWKDADVASWLTSHRLGHHAGTFADNDITGNVLLDVDQSALKEMGIVAVGERIRVFTALKALRKQCTQTAQGNRLKQLQAEREAQMQMQEAEVQFAGADAASARMGGAVSPTQSVSAATRRPFQARPPPPLHLVHPSVSSVPATPPPLSSPSSVIHSHGLGLSQARGLTPGSSYKAPNPANVGQGRSPVPPPQQPTSPHMTHRKTNSAVPGSFPTRNGASTLQQRQYGSLSGSSGRPATSGSIQSPARGPLGAPVSSSPTSTTFGTRLQRPETGGDGSAPSGYHAMRTSEGMNVEYDGSLSPSTLAMNRRRSAYNLPMVPPTLEDLKRRTIKFIGDDGTTRTINVSDCRDAHDVLARVLRKFGKSSASNSYPPTLGQEPESPQADATDKYVIVATSDEGATRDLKPEELLAICHAPQPYDPLRERGLTLRRLNVSSEAPTSRRAARSGRNKLEAFFGERIGGDSSTHHTTPDESSASVEAGHVTTAGKRMNRASTVSIMSGLGAGALMAMRSGVALSSPRSNSGQDLSSTARTSSTNAATSLLPRKARNFMGQRPPSELISSHLADYFPATEKRLLERTARRSVYGRSSSSVRSNKRDSTWSFNALAEGDEAPPPLPTKGSFDEKRGQAPVLPPVARQSSMDEWSKQVHSTANVDSGRQLDIPDARPRNLRRISSGRTSIDSSRSRRSYASQLRAAKSYASSGNVDRSDAASMMTVDEITQEVESRRDSMQVQRPSIVVDEDGVPIPLSAGATKARTISTSKSGALGSILGAEEGGGASPESLHGSPALGSSSDEGLGAAQSEAISEEGEEEEEEEEEEEDIGSDDDDDDDEGDDGIEKQEIADATIVAPQTATAPSKQAFKWIKGALIGAGSFGSVYLGMVAKSGLLMAVKQVELPSGNTQNDQKKKRMLDALEGEIELLKTLQHDNIVQYLDSYADGTHLNIFLEYVPGGSVVALLRNYGAFEEPLVRNFVGQILKGLQFLHERDIVHRDIKGANILVDNKSCIKISDFGISKKVESDLLTNARAHRPSLQGSVFWMAPEVVKQTSYTRKADIWSLGCLVVEMMSGTHPWPNLNQMQALFKIGSSSKPSLPEEISTNAVDFLNKTFEIDHNHRPSADELLQHPFITEEAADEDDARDEDEETGGPLQEEEVLDAVLSAGPSPLAAAATTPSGTIRGKRKFVAKEKESSGLATAMQDDGVITAKVLTTG